MSNIFLIVILLLYLATWALDFARLKRATGREKGIYYTLAVSVLGLYSAMLLQFDVPMPTHWVIYTWSDWLHGLLSM